MSTHSLVEKRRKLSDRRLKDEVADIDRRKGSRRAIIEEFRRRIATRRKSGETVVGIERRENKGRRIEDIEKVADLGRD
jgi:hypothetical protein